MRAGLLVALLAGCPQAAPDDTDDDEVPGCGDAVCDADEEVATCPYDCGFPYLLVVDQNNGTSGGAPGVDLDAVKMVRDGTVHWAAAVAASAIGGPENEWTDPTEALGASDSGCVTDNFVALGGIGSWIALTFGEGVVVRPGDAITVYELSADMCDNDMRNDAWEVLLAPTPDPYAGEYVGYGFGLGDFEVPAF